MDENGSNPWSIREDSAPTPSSIPASRSIKGITRSYDLADKWKTHTSQEWASTSHSIQSNIVLLLKSLLPCGIGSTIRSDLEISDVGAFWRYLEQAPEMTIELDHRYMPSSTRSNKETQLLFSPDPASLERSIRKEARSSSIDNNTCSSLDFVQPPSTDTRSPPSTEDTHLPLTNIVHPISIDTPARTSTDTELREMSAGTKSRAPCLDIDRCVCFTLGVSITGCKDFRQVSGTAGLVAKIGQASMNQGLMVVATKSCSLLFDPYPRILCEASLEDRRLKVPFEFLYWNLYEASFNGFSHQVLFRFLLTRS
ncbi:hypothetical protein DY000_02007058 [Brassica cretica]|uniref:Uncharacterized protein n=1 Tax=Brassica cretica TaxID=69181 RepID=A0ABQ7BVI0_BRACR|nr:hypothetical protein DY000_02007058 [Brassica cretica]